MQGPCVEYIMPVSNNFHMTIRAHTNDILKAIYSGMGFADNPNIDDYYTRVRGFPITYFPNDDPEVHN